MAIDDQLATLLAQNADLFATYEEWSNSQVMLLAGSITDPASFDIHGGKTGPLGYYPVVNVSGQTIYVACMDRLRHAAIDGVSDALDAVSVVGDGLLRSTGSINEELRLDVVAATAEETIAGARADVAVTPVGAKAAIDQSISALAAQTGSELGLRPTFLNLGSVALEEYGLGSGANDTLTFQRAFQDADGRYIICRGGTNATIRLPDPIQQATGWNIELRGAHVEAPHGLLNSNVPYLRSYSGGNLFTTEDGLTGITFTPGMMLQRGDTIIAESDDIRVATGNYRHGHRAEVVWNDTTSAIVHPPFYGHFRVDRVRVLRRVAHKLEDLLLDMTASEKVTDPAINAYLGINITGSNDVEIAGARMYGSDYAAAGMVLQGTRVRVLDSYGEGYLNREGLPGGGRAGYFCNLEGLEVLADNVSGSRCKHVITSAGRLITTYRMEVRAGLLTSPKSGFAEVETLQTGGPDQTYGPPLDAHANVLDFVVNQVTVDGVHGLIQARGGHATINNPILRSRGMSDGWAAISISEAPVKRIVVYSPDYTVDARPGATNPAYLVGFVFSPTGAPNGEILITNPKFDGGAIFTMKQSADAAAMAATSLARLAVTGASGRVSGGILIRGNPAQPFGAIGPINLEGDLVCDAASGATTALIDVGNCASIGKPKTRGEFDWRAFKGTYAVTIGGGAVDLSAGADFRDTALKADLAAYAITSTTTIPAGRMRWDGGEIYHQYNAGLNVFAPGIYFDLAAVFGEEATFNRTKMRNITNPANTAGKNIELGVNKRAALSLDGANLNTDISTNMTDPWDAPVGARKGGGRLAWRYGLSVDAQGNLFGAAKPTTTALPVDTIVRNTGSAPANASEWVYTGATYGWCARSFTQFVKNGAPSGAPNDVGIVMVDGAGKHGYVSVDTTVAGWKQIDN